MLSVSLLLPHIGGCARLMEGVVPDAPCFCFAATAVSKERCQSLHECQGAAAKEDGRASGLNLPRLPGCGSEKRRAVRLEGTRTFIGVKSGYRKQRPRRPPGQSPRNRAGKGVPGEDRNAAVQRLFSYTIKRRILFSAPSKREWGFCPAAEPQASGFPGTPVSTGQTPLF